jgi:hypothetical protein
MGRKTAGGADNYGSMPGHGPGDEPGSEKFWWHRYLTGAGTQAGSLCHQCIATAKEFVPLREAV